MNGEGCVCVMLYVFHNSHATTLINGKEIGLFIKIYFLFNIF